VDDVEAVVGLSWGLLPADSAARRAALEPGLLRCLASMAAAAVEEVGLDGDDDDAFADERCSCIWICQPREAAALAAALSSLSPTEGKEGRSFGFAYLRRPACAAATDKKIT